MAFDSITRRVSIEYGRYTPKDATNDTLQSCKAKGGKSCQLITTTDGIASVVMDGDGRFFIGKSSISEVKALRQAFSDCNIQSPVGTCRLISPPIIYGVSPPLETLRSPDVEELLNLNSKSMSDVIEAQRLASDLDALSVRMDTRDYWGAIASDGDDINSTYNLPDQKSAELHALDGCRDCKVVLTFKNSCAAFAWPRIKQATLELETAIDADPAVAKQKALARCSSNHGACDVEARCSGRLYPKANLNVPDSPPEK